MNLDQWLVVIPARLNSQRLPRKPLVLICGKPLIVRVWENLQALKKHGAQLVVATDSDEVVALCTSHGISVELSSPDHPSGTDRCNEVASRYPHPFILNVQGDEPFIDCNDLVGLMKQMQAHTTADMGTMIVSESNPEQLVNPNTVKVVKDAHNYALYFSRLPIPYWRDNSTDAYLGGHYLHLGVYAFRRAALSRFCSFPLGHLEAAEKLEQLRALENAMRIYLVEAQSHHSGIDTPEDVVRAEKMLK
jgi:3-deoxy-manno-octulosonate cytidylyltransferase (CMP-KDO synthetase)